MGNESEGVPMSSGLAILLVVAPFAAGGLLFILFESGPIHDLGLFLIGAGVIVGGALLLMRRE